MNISLSIEEITALKVANQFTRIEAISYFTSTLPYYDESEVDMISFINTLLSKLTNMSNEQYAEIDYSLAIEVPTSAETE